MEPRILNFPDAMRLAALLKSSGNEFGGIDQESMKLWLDGIHHIIYSEILVLLTGRELRELGSLSGDESLRILIHGLTMNRADELLRLERYLET